MANINAKAFYRVITEAVNDIAQHGFDSSNRIEQWADAIRRAAIGAMLTPDQMEAMLRDSLNSIYSRLVESGGILKTHSINRFTLAHLAPRLRAELDRRLVASASLIKLNREQMIARTQQRFVGWATSVPAGGSKAADKVEAKANIRKALASLPFEQRRVMIDQGHKLTASINEIVATDQGAIAVEWHSHWRQPGYNFREDHKERDEQVYALRGNWAMTKGLMRPGQAGYYEQITAFGEEPFCRCYGRYIYSLRRLPDDMVTAKGREALATVKAAA